MLQNCIMRNALLCMRRNINLSRALSNTTTTTTNSAEQQPQGNDQTVNIENEYKTLLEKHKKYETDISELKDKYMRALAEAENTRVRMRKQVDDAKIFGIQGFCKDLLEVADTLHLAVVNTDINKLTNSSDKQITEDKLKLTQTHLKAIFNGLLLTENKLIKIFEKHGLSRIVPNEGDKFDPNFHDAIFQAKIENKESGTICTVNQIGYKLQERVIRAAQVGVVQ